MRKTQHDCKQSWHAILAGLVCAVQKSHSFFCSLRIFGVSKNQFCKIFFAQVLKNLFANLDAAANHFLFLRCEKVATFLTCKNAKIKFLQVAKWATLTTSKHALNWHPRAFATALGHWLIDTDARPCRSFFEFANSKNDSAASCLLCLLVCRRRMTAQGLYTLYYDCTSCTSQAVLHLHTSVGTRQFWSGDYWPVIATSSLCQHCPTTTPQTPSEPFWGAFRCYAVLKKT